MAEELVDFRTRITRETDAVLEAYWRAHGLESKSEVARQVLQEWADKQVHTTKLLHAAMRREGLIGD